MFHAVVDTFLCKEELHGSGAVITQGSAGMARNVLAGVSIPVSRPSAQTSVPFLLSLCNFILFYRLEDIQLFHRVTLRSVRPIVLALQYRQQSIRYSNACHARLIFQRAPVPLGVLRCISHLPGIASCLMTLRRQGVHHDAQGWPEEKCTAE